MILRYNSEQGINYRPDTGDEYVLSHIKEYAALDVSGQIVLDIGAHIGVFVAWVLKNGAKQVIAVEAEPENSLLLRINHGDNPVINIISAAAITGKDATVTFYRAGINTGCHSVYQKTNDSIIVPAVNFAKLLDEYHPTVVKMDCEAAEFDLLSEPLPDCVRQLGVEIHSWFNEDCAGRAEVLLKSLKEQGFTAKGLMTEDVPEVFTR
jgi:FkbM family methyltransferase